MSVPEQKRIIFLRHGDKPNDTKSLERIMSRLGLNIQGAIRAQLMPRLIKRLIGNQKAK